jgi:hypothetical protein
MSDSISILEDLLVVLAAQGVLIRKTAMGGEGGGLCKVRGANTFFVDTQGDSMETAVKAAKALRSVVDVEKIFLKPHRRIRQRLGYRL